MKNNSQIDNETNRKTSPFRIVILGGGTAGWMAANLFAKQWQSDRVEVQLIESPDVGIIGVGEGSTPTLKRFFKKLDIDESDWMPQCNATYKVNIRFEGWSPASGITYYSHPFTSQVDVFTTRSFMLNCRTRCLGLDTHTRPEDFILNGLLAKEGKTPQAPTNFPFIMEYGYHFDSNLLGKYLAKLAQSNGVRYRQLHIADASLSPKGEVNCLLTKEGENINADLFVDCSGFSSVLMQKKLKIPFKSYKENLFNDSAVVMPTPISSQIPVETLSTALSSGWCWKIPLSNRFGNGYVYSSDFISADNAELEFRKHIGTIDSKEECRHLKMQVGQLETHWTHNCIGLGLSQGFIEPLEATALHLVQLCIEDFIKALEKGDFTSQYRREYNQQISERFDRTRDYIVAHYKLNTKRDNEYWLANSNNNNLSNSLIGLLDCWYKQGDLQKEIQDQNIGHYFDAVSWHCLLAGYGAFPNLASVQPGTGDQYIGQNIEKFINGCGENFKTV